MSKAVQEKKKEEVYVGNLKIVYKDITREIEEFLIASATAAIKSFYKSGKGHYKDVAEKIKKEIETQYKGTWHVIVGRSFGSYVTHEVQRIIFFFLGQIGFLIFKHT